MQQHQGENYKPPPTLTSRIKEMFSRMEMRIAIRAGIAASVSLYIGTNFAKILNRPDYLLSGTWCVLSTFIVLQAHLGGTYRAAWFRFLGVLIGSFMGGLFTTVFGSNLVSLGVSVILTVLICSMFNLKDSIRIACLSLSVVMILWGLHPEVSSWMFGLYRFLDSSLGILIAVIIAHTFWPAQATHKMRLNIAKTLQAISRYYRLVLNLNPEMKNFDRACNRYIRLINRLLDETRHFLKESELELLTNTKSLEDWSNLIDHLENIFESITAFIAFHKYNIKRIFDKKLTDQVVNTIEKTDHSFKELSEMLKTEKTPIPFTDLRDTVEDLNQELTRIRATKVTRQLERPEVEHFFVFFYHLRSVIEEVLKMEEQVKILNEQPA